MSAEHTPPHQPHGPTQSPRPPFQHAPQAHPSAPHRPPVRQPQPLQLAKVLLILFLVRILLFAGTEFGVDAVFGILGRTGVDSSLVYAVAGAAASLLALLSGGVWVACLVLGIVVIVKARERLRTGAIVMLVALVVPTFFAFDITGDFSSGVATAVGIVNLVFDLLALIASVVAAYFLWRGYRAAAPEEDSRYAVI